MKRDSPPGYKVGRRGGPCALPIPLTSSRTAILTTLPLLIGVVVTLTLLAASTPRASAHASLESSSPPADALLAVPPDELVLRFTEPVDPASVAIAVVDESGGAITVSPPTVDPSDPRTVRASLDGVSFGTVTVSWRVRSSVDGHELAGSFAFRVGGSDRAPAAATVEGGRPAGWNVVTRWLTFLGLACAVGLLIVPITARRVRIAETGALLGLIASLAEPLLLALVPPAGRAAPSLLAAVEAQPMSWGLRPVGAVATLLLLLVPRLGLTRVAPVAGMVGILGLAFTTHAAGRETWQGPALLSAVAHEEAVALWIGGLLLLVGDRSAAWTAELRSFSRRALPLGVLAIVTGLVNAGFMLRGLDDLRESDYGRVLSAKAIVVATVLALGGLHWLRLRRAGEVAGSTRTTVTTEGALATGVLLIAATLALLAPPAAGRRTTTVVDLALPVTAALDTEQPYVRLQIEALEEERKRLTVQATDGAPLHFEQVDGQLQRLEAARLSDVQTVRVTLSSLSEPIAPRTLELTPRGDGAFTTEGFSFSIDGWWQADVLVRRAGLEDATVSFVLLEPDPNVVGFENVPDLGSDPEAQALLDRAMTAYGQRTSWVYLESLNGGQGGVEILETSYASGTGSPPIVEIRTPEMTLIRSDGRRYQREGDGPWRNTDDNPVSPPAELLQDYAGAIDVQLGVTATIDGRECRIVTFHVPAGSYVAAWYAWWVDVETGELRQEAMISRGHYMVKRFTAVNEPVEIVVPA